MVSVDVLFIGKIVCFHVVINHRMWVRESIVTSSAYRYDYDNWNVLKNWSKQRMLRTIGTTNYLFNKKYIYIYKMYI